MHITERIGLIIGNEKISVRRFEAKCGLSNNSIQTAIKRRTNVKDSTLNSILQAFPDYDPEWLLTGAGIMKRGAKMNSDCLDCVDKERTINVLTKQLEKTQRELENCLEGQGNSKLNSA